jgi:hypothetical protein
VGIGVDNQHRIIVEIKLVAIAQRQRVTIEHRSRVYKDMR